jgi:catechol 2,3-dioxygenase-like lactoylglutathione lyase family enzyme
MQLSHIGIFVQDFDRMIEFYRDTLGFVVTDIERSAERHIVFLTTDPKIHHQLVLVKGRAADVTSRAFVNQISFAVDDLPALRSAYAKLVKSEAKELDPITHGTTWSVYFRDPEDNRAEVYCDTPWYITQPHRTSIDLTKPEDVLYAETEAHVRKQPGFKFRKQFDAEVEKLIRGTEI